MDKLAGCLVRAWCLSNLSAAEREVLEGWSRRRKTGQGLALRSRVVLACAGGGSNAQVAADLGVTWGSVAKWRGRFATGRLKGLADEPRPDAARKVSDAQVEAVIARTLAEAPPKGDTHWMSRSMAKATGVSQVDDLADVAGLRPQITPGRDLEAVG